MSIMDLVNKIAKEECWAHKTYEGWVNRDLLVNAVEEKPEIFGFFCIIDNLPIGELIQ